jgi:hypothetical protein
MRGRGSTFRLTLCGLRLCVLRSFVWIVVAAGVASTGAALPVEACTFKPYGRAPHGWHWYYMLDRAKRHCWYLGPAGLAVQRSAKRRLRHRAAVRHERLAAKKTAATGPAAARLTTTEPGSTLPATTAESGATLAATAGSDATPAPANGADSHAPALPPPEPGGVSERWSAAEPAEQQSAGETQSPNGVALPPEAMPTPPRMPAEAPQPAVTAPSERAGISDHDHTFASIGIAAALLVFAGPVLWAMGRRSRRKVWAATPSAPPVRPSLVLERTAVRHRQPPGARDQAGEEIGPRRLLDGAPRHAVRGRLTR